MYLLIVNHPSQGYFASSRNTYTIIHGNRINTDDPLVYDHYSWGFYGMWTNAAFDSAESNIWLRETFPV